jgi:hypothetical protein
MKGKPTMFIKREGTKVILPRTAVSAIVMAAMLLGTFFGFG